jgi:hypothetical protein
VEILHPLLDSLAGAALFCGKLILILVPLVMGFEFVAGSRWLRRDFPLFRRILGALGLSPAAGAPLLAGFFLGIAYGAGIIIPAAKERNLGARDILGVSIFLCTCHAIFEDILLFVWIGASGPWLLGVRFTLAVIAVRLVTRPFASRLLPRPTGG